MIQLKTEEEIKTLKESGKILSSVLRALVGHAKKGVALSELDKTARHLLKEAEAEPAFLGYKPDGADRAFPAAICASLNDVVVHGVPDERRLVSGDVLTIDMGVRYKGMITDAAVSVAIGKVSKIARDLMSSTKAALDDAIKAAKKGKTLGDIGCAIEKRAKKDGFYVVKSLTGHGVGYEVHEDPVVYNFGRRGEGVALQEGMVLAIEPMFSTSSGEIVQNDDESYSTVGRGLTAHFEHTIAVTKKGVEVLTK